MLRFMSVKKLLSLKVRKVDCFIIQTSLVTCIIVYDLTTEFMILEKIKKM